MTVILCGERRYVVTSEDRLWLLRAVQAEGPVERQVAQVLVNLHAWLVSGNSRSTLTKLVRAYAQPVNPRWYPDGDLFLRWHARDPVKYPLAAAQLRLKKSARTVFTSVVREAVDRALEHGPVDIPSIATDYAASWIDASHKYRALTPARPGVNRLWTRAESWAGYRVELDGGHVREMDEECR